MQLKTDFITNYDQFGEEEGTKQSEENKHSSNPGPEGPNKTHSEKLQEPVPVPRGMNVSLSEFPGKRDPRQSIKWKK